MRLGTTGKRLLGLAAIAGGLLVLRPLMSTTMPGTSAWLELTGPFRTLPLPFVWSAWNAANRRHDVAGIRATGRWLTWLSPQRRDLFLGHAWDLAHNLASLESSPERRARLLLEAVDLLDEGLRLHPRTWLFPAHAGFHLQTCAEHDSALIPVFQRLTGQDPLQLAKRYFQAARRLAPGIRWLAWQEALSDELSAVLAFLAGDRQAASQQLRHAIALRTANPTRRALLERTAEAIERRLSRLPRDLSAKLRKDPVLSRIADRWQ